MVFPTHRAGTTGPPQARRGIQTTLCVCARTLRAEPKVFFLSATHSTTGLAILTWGLKWVWGPEQIDTTAGKGPAFAGTRPGFNPWYSIPYSQPGVSPSHCQVWPQNQNKNIKGLDQGWSESSNGLASAFYTGSLDRSPARHGPPGATGSDPRVQSQV